ncbi:hypothetical protein AVT69_gp049 [Pseudomonas phage PhiPA3]|uniref:Uncharacterized protein 048 n=1 Tax=Pseudomonas phage PhiPA3 TaxID=998086 RepID=F8SJT0_BPPA3|nr:hypothetical protein AVT69_gp049 [Pseudomonas phage PhiPA3]AEH03475.1 hypothetical protein [Pseudomonas phage PhiPA3]
MKGQEYIAKKGDAVKVIFHSGIGSINAGRIKLDKEYDATISYFSDKATHMMFSFTREDGEKGELMRHVTGSDTTWTLILTEDEARRRKQKVIQRRTKQAEDQCKRKIIEANMLFD